MSSCKALKKPAAHAQAQSEQMDARTAIRTVFRQLASALHPDREPDAQERERKTALMSEVNAAYDKNDLAQLEAQLTQTLCIPVSAQQSEAAMTQSLLRLQAEQRQVADSLAADLQRIQNGNEPKRWLKEQSRAFKAASE